MLFSKYTFAGTSYLTSLLFVSLLFSCTKNLLEPVAQTNISDANAFDTKERITAQVNGLYASVKSGNFYGGRLIIYNEIRADEFIMNKPNSVTGQLTWSHNLNSGTSEVKSLWSAGYASINRINTFLTGLDANRSKVSDSLYRNFSAEAKFLRALCYFALVQTYARPYTSDNGASLGLPIRLNAENSGANNDLARNTVAQVYDQILKDLNDAEVALPLTYGSASLNTTRAHRNTVIAFKTRVYLVKADYANVVLSAAKIVSASAPFQATSGVNNKLEANIANVFTGSYSGNEAVFFLPFTATETPGTQNQLAYYFNISPGNAEYYLNASAIIANPVFASTSTDARRNLLQTSGGNKWLTKYKVPSTFSDWIPVIRYAEVLLNYAEAAARTNDKAKATSLLEAVRKRSDPTYSFPVSADPAQGANQAALINAILLERKIELLGEGFRVPDLQRLLLPLPGKSGPAGSAPEVPVSASNYIWPVSGDELATNKLIEPNP